LQFGIVERGLSNVGPLATHQLIAYLVLPIGQQHDIRVEGRQIYLPPRELGGARDCLLPSSRTLVPLHDGAVEQSLALEEPAPEDAVAGIVNVVVR